MMGRRAPSDLAEPPIRAWWNSRLVVPGLMLLSTIPFWFVRTPPLIDLLAHIGRYHVQLHLADSPALQRSWDFHWHLVGNLGVELLIAPLAGMFGFDRAVWLIALALPPLMIWGIGRISRALESGWAISIHHGYTEGQGYPLSSRVVDELSPSHGERRRAGGCR